ncbi:MAG: phenylalanine--tRNA ligase subunit beta [Candidatus Hydrothermia bacterium]
MKVTYNILKEYLSELPLSPVELAELFPKLGIEVENFADLAEGLRGYVRCALVKEVKPLDEIAHYKLTRLHLGDVELTVVSTAPNIREGMKVAVALPGAKVKGNIISEREIKGFKSQGNILSYEELGIMLDSPGVVELPDDFEIGTSPLSYLGIDDWLYDLYIFPHRPDLLGIIGLAHEISVHTKSEVILPKVGIEETLDEIPLVKVEDGEGCPVYSARVIKGVKVKESPYELKIKLLKLGQRPINNVVDVTNYVMFELGQPIHAFDKAKVEGSIIVRRARSGEKILCLDGELRELKEEILVIADEVKPLAIAGIIGGEESSVSESTTDLIIESAYFDRVSIRKAVTTLNISTESSRRFERGGDPNIVEMASKRVAFLIKELAGGEIGRITTVRAKNFEPRRIYLSINNFERMFAQAVEAKEVKKILERYGFVVHPQAGGFEVVVPTRRRDIEVWEDLAEEILKVMGYDSVKGEIKSCGYLTGKKLNTKDRILKHCIEKAGFYEVKSIEFVAPSELKLFGQHEEEFVKIRNPINVELSVLRTSLLPGLLRIASHNLRMGVDNVRIFEIGKVFRWRGEKELPLEEIMLGVVCAGEISKSWDVAERKVDVYDLLTVFGVLKHQIEGSLEFVPEDLTVYGLSGGARIVYNGKFIGLIGEVIPKVKKYYDIKSQVFALELKLDPLVLRRPKFSGIPQYPATSRDVSVIMSEKDSIRPIIDLARQSFANILEDYKVIDIYTGKPIPEGHKSITLKFTFRSSERTLMQEEVDMMFSAFIAELRERGYKIRGLNA